MKKIWINYLIKLILKRINEIQDQFYASELSKELENILFSEYDELKSLLEHLESLPEYRGDN